MTPNLIYHPGTGHRTGRLPRLSGFFFALRNVCVSVSRLSFTHSVFLALFASFTLSVCQILPKGVVSVIGPASSPASGSTVSHICGEKEVRNERADVCVCLRESILEMINSHCSSAAGYYFLCAFAVPLENYISP